jgi:DNA polymerase elongation subunit (family B)
MDMLGIDKRKLSPVGIITSEETTTPEKITYTKFDWVGRYLLDYRELFIKYSYDKLAKYSLEYVATHVLGVGKVDHDEYLSLEDLYLNNYNKFVQYGITDIELLIAMDKKLKFIATASMVSWTCGVNIYDVFGTLKQWSSFMYNEAMKQNKILPLQQQFSDPYAVYVGGWTKSSPGKHSWVVSFDFASLYPSNIRFLNIGTDTLVKEKLSREDSINFEISRLKYELNLMDP